MLFKKWSELKATMLKVVFIFWGSLNKRKVF